MNMRGSRPSQHGLQIIAAAGLLLAASALPALGEPAKPPLLPAGQAVEMSERVIAGLSGHALGDVEQIAWSADGKRIATASYGTVAQVRDVESGRLVSVLKGHLREIDRLLWSPDGRYIATAAGDDYTRVWEPETGREIARMEVDEFSAEALAWSPDGARLAVARHGSVPILTVETKEEFVLRGGGFSTADAMAWSPDGKSLAISVTDYGRQPNAHEIYVIDVESLVPIALLKGHEGTIETLEWSSGGAYLASGSRDETARIWKPATGEMIAEMSYFEDDAAHGLDWEPNGTRLAHAGQGNTATIRDMETNEDVARFAVGDAGNEITGVRWSPGGGAIAATDDAGAFHILETTGFERQTVLAGHEGGINAFAWSPDGSRIAAGTDDEAALIWYAVTGELAQTLAGRTEPVDRVAFAPGTKRAAAALGDGRIVLWDTETGLPLHVLHGHQGDIRVLAFSPDGSRLASADTVEGNRIWSVETGNLVAMLEGHTNDVLSYSWSPDGTRIATGSFDETARIWDAQSGEQIALLPGHAENVYKVDWSPDGTRIATAGDDRTVRIFDAETAELVASHDAHEEEVQNVAWSPDGTLLASASYDNTARVWNSETGEVTTVMCCRVDLTMPLAWSPDGNRLASSKNADIAVWDRRTGGTVEAGESLSHYPEYLVWSPDGEFVAGGSEFAQTKIFGVQYGLRLRGFNDGQRIFNWLDWRPDDGVILTGDANGLIETWSAQGEPLKVLVIDRDDGWVSCDWQTSRCLRNDTGALLQVSEDTGLRVIPLPDALGPKN
jgi:WD40 repeat protein